MDVIKSNTNVSEESRPVKEDILFTKDREQDEWDALLERNPYWRTLRVTSWVLRFVHNCLAKLRKEKTKTGPIDHNEISGAENDWIRR